MKDKYYFIIFFALLIAGSFVFYKASFRTGKAEISESEHAKTCGASAGSSAHLLRNFPMEGEPSKKLALLILDVEADEDLILASYRNPFLRKEVLAFFEGITGALETAEVILFYSSVYDIPPALAFSLCAEESAYNPRAFNRNRNETQDRGLFQLNSATFPKLKTDDFYDPAINAQHGISHLRWCLNMAGTEIAGLAMYNAGATRVSSIGTPKSTLDYVSRIIKRQRDMEERFMAEYVRIMQTADSETEIAEERGKSLFWLSLLSPLRH